MGRDVILYFLLFAIFAEKDGSIRSPWLRLGTARLKALRVTLKEEEEEL